MDETATRSRGDARRSREPRAWRPPIVETVATDGDGVDELWTRSLRTVSISFSPTSSSRGGVARCARGAAGHRARTSAVDRRGHVQRPRLRRARGAGRGARHRRLHGGATACSTHSGRGGSMTDDALVITERPDRRRRARAPQPSAHEPTVVRTPRRDLRRRRGARGDATVKAVVLTGSERASQRAPTSASSSIRTRRSGSALRSARAIDALARDPAPVIAAIRGYALGGGLEARARVRPPGRVVTPRASVPGDPARHLPRWRWHATAAAAGRAGARQRDHLERPPGPGRRSARARHRRPRGAR